MDENGNHLLTRLNGQPLARAAALLLIVLFLVLTTIASAFALVVTAPSSVNEGQPMTVSVTGPGTLSITRQSPLSPSVVVATGVGTLTDTLQTNGTSSGLYTYQFSSDASGQQNDTKTIEVIDVPLSIVPLAPASSDVMSSDVTFTVSANWAPDFCYVTIDGISHSLVSVTPSLFNSTLAVAEGVHIVEYKCTLGAQTATAQKSLHVDSLPPHIIAASPSGDVSGPYVTLTVDTDEIAQCRYGSSDASFASLPTLMSDTYAIRNTVTITESAQGPFTYFVRCQDVYGNAMTAPTIISFVNKLPPTAIVDVNGDEPLKAGTYEVTLTTSQPLNVPPVFSYNLQQSSGNQQIALTGTGSSWKGYIIVPSGAPDTVVSFSYSGVSLQGVAGTQITQGGLIAVDAKPPKQVDAISVDNSSKEIVLKWFTTDDADSVSFNIYRADHEGVTYTDFYASATGTEYVDRGAQAARYYYYRVAPVDAAGNIGPLSTEVYGSVIDKQLQSDTGTVADALQMARLDEEMASLTAAQLDANASVSALESESNPTNIGVIKDMNLVAQAREGVGKLNEAAALLQALRNRNPTSAEVDEGIARERALVTESRKLIIRRITPLEQTEIKQVTDLEGLERALPYALVGQSLSATDRNAYFVSATKLQDLVSVTLTATSFKLYTLGGEEQQFTFVRKNVVLQNPQNDVTLIENIPKSVAASAGDVTFSTPPAVLENDPVVAYKFPVLERQEYTYFVRRIVSLEDVKKTRSFIYPTIPAASASIPAGDDSITGQVTRVALPFVPSTDIFLIMLGLFIIIGLAAYYVSLTSDKPFKGIRQRHVAQRVVPSSQSVKQPTRPVTRVSSISSNVPRRIVTSSLSVPVSASARRDHPMTSEDVQSRLTHAEMAIDRKDYDASTAHYRAVIDVLQQDEGLSAMLHEQAVRVYDKLLLYRRLADAKQAAEQKDAVLLRHALDDAKMLATKVGEDDTTLINDAKRAYAEFAAILNQLEIAKNAHY